MSAPQPEPPGRIRVVLVDRDDLVRQTVAALLGIGGAIEVVGIAGHVGPALDLVITARPDVVVVDPRLPDVERGLAFVARLHATAPDVKVLLVCSPELLDRITAAAGVDRCVRKTYRPDEMTAAIIATSRSTPA